MSLFVAGLGFGEDGLLDEATLVVLTVYAVAAF